MRGKSFLLRKVTSNHRVRNDHQRKGKKVQGLDITLHTPVDRLKGTFQYRLARSWDISQRWLSHNAYAGVAHQCEKAEKRISLKGSQSHASKLDEKISER